MSKSTTRRRVRMRCNHRNCAKRFTLKRDPALYARSVKCPRCGSVQVRSVEGQRRRALAKQDTCGCLHFPHRRGTVVGCVDHTAAYIDKYGELCEFTQSNVG